MSIKKQERANIERGKEDVNKKDKRVKDGVGEGMG